MTSTSYGNTQKLHEWLRFHVSNITMLNEWSSQLSSSAWIWRWRGLVVIRDALIGEEGEGKSNSIAFRRYPIAPEAFIWTSECFFFNENLLSTFVSINHHLLSYLKEKLVPLSQLSPVHPSMHLHVPLTHLPLPEHWLGQSEGRKNISWILIVSSKTFTFIYLNCFHAFPSGFIIC